MRRPLLLLLCAVLLLAARPSFSQNTPAGAVAVAFELNGFVASGFTPGGAVAVFAAFREMESMNLMQVGSLELLREADGGGELHVDLGRPLTRSIWVVVDQASGRYSIVTTDGSAIDALQAPRRGKKDDEDEFEMSLQLARLIVVRPGDGAWSVEVADGGPDDDDGMQNGKIHVGGRKLKHFRKKVAKELKKLAKDDLVFVIDPTELKIYGGRVDE